MEKQRYKGILLYYSARHFALMNIFVRAAGVSTVCPEKLFAA